MGGNRLEDRHDVSDPKDPYGNPPGWTDPYADLTDISGNDPIPPLEDPNIPPATPPGSPLLTGLVVGLLLVALSVAVFQLLKSDDTTASRGDNHHHRWRRIGDDGSGRRLDHVDHHRNDNPSFSAVRGSWEPDRSRQV